MINACSINPNAVNLKIVPNHDGIFNSRLSHNYSIELWKYLYLWLIVKWFQRMCRV